MTSSRKNRGGEVESAVFRVESEGNIFWVVQEHSGKSASRFVCTCPQKYGCEHVGIVMAHMDRLVKQAGGGGSITGKPGTAESSRDSFSSLVPGPPVDPALKKKSEAIGDNPEELEPIVEKLKAFVSLVAGVKISQNRKELAGPIDDVIQSLEGIFATDMLKSVAGLRRSVLAEKPDPIAICIGIERVLGVIRILERRLNNESVNEKLQKTYLDRDWEIEETKQKEDVYLIEIARNSVLTPFEMRRSESFYMNTESGHLYIEEKYLRPGGGNPSVGPFPRLMHVNLMTVEPRLQPPCVNLMQYSVLPPPSEGELLKIKKLAGLTVDEAIRLYMKVVRIAGAPYPVFFTFAPLKTRIRGGRLIMWDSEGAMLGLAYCSAPYGCMAAREICESNQLHAICGMLVREGRYLAINPFSLLIEDSSGLNMIRIK